MTAEKTWQIDGNLSDIAEMVHDEYYSIDSSWLLTCPDKLKARCWDSLTAFSWDEHAATILMLVARVAWEDGRDVCAAMELKRLFESCLTTKSALKDKIVRSLTSHAQQQMKLIMRNHAIPEELLDANPMNAIEECFFGPDESTESYLMGGLLLTGYRNIAIDSEPSGFVASLFAIREAFAYFHAGQSEAAISSLGWARSVFEQIEPDLDRPQSEIIGQCLSASAHAAEEAAQFDDCLSLWREALRFLPPRGDDCANGHFNVGRELERRGEHRNAMQAYQAALDTPGVRDPDLAKVVKLTVSTIRTQLESDPNQLRIDDQPSRELGGSKDFSQSMQQILRSLALGDHIPDADLLNGIASIREWIEWREAQGLTDGQSLSMLVGVLKMCLSLQEPSKLPVPYLDLLLQCERNLSLADDSTRIEYEMICETILQQCGFSTRLKFAMGKRRS